MATVTYKSKKDGWLIMVIYGVVLASLAGSMTLVLSRTVMNLFTAAVMFVLGVILPMWLVRTTYYVLDDRQLAVKCGPFNWSIPLAKIRSVKRTRSMLSGPALSLDRVQIRYGRLGIFGLVLISPENREQFLSDLENRRNRLAQGARSA